MSQLISEFGPGAVVGIGGKTAEMEGATYFKAPDGLEYVSNLDQRDFTIINCANSYKPDLINDLLQLEVNYLWPLRLLGRIKADAFVNWLEISSLWALENSSGNRMTWYGTSKCAAITGLRRRVHEREGSFRVAFVGDLCGRDDPRGKVPSLSLTLGQSGQQLFLTGGHQLLRPTDVSEAAATIRHLVGEADRSRIQVSGPPIQLCSFVDLVNAHYERNALILREGPVAHWLYPCDSEIGQIEKIETSSFEILLERTKSERS